MSRIIAARRTPVAPRNGLLRALEPHELVAPIAHELISITGISARDVGEFVLSNSLGAGGNPARIAALASGLPDKVAGLTTDRQCAGGLDAISLAAMMVDSGLHDVVLAGGVESYSRRPLRYRTFADGREAEQYDQARFTPWVDKDPDMAVAANQLALKLGISRELQDEWALESHQKALDAGPDPRIVPIEGLDHDAFTRRLSARLLRKAPSIVGNITAANMAVAADGAALVVVVSDRFAGTNGVEIVCGRTIGAQPDCPGLSPLPAISTVLKITDLKPEDLSVAIIMEAFAVQAIACQQGAGIPKNIVNPMGGALARGHPIGASGALIAVDLIRALDTKPGYGLAAIAAAGGVGSALILRSDPAPI